jgi:hypothetical protein
MQCPIWIPVKPGEGGLPGGLSGDGRWRAGDFFDWMNYETRQNKGFSIGWHLLGRNKPATVFCYRSLVVGRKVGETNS